VNWLTKVIPWPSRRDRREAIAGARAEKKQSAATAARADQLRQEITRLARENHFASVIATQIIQGRGGQ